MSLSLSLSLNVSLSLSFQEVDVFVRFYRPWSDGKRRALKTDLSFLKAHLVHGPFPYESLSLYGIVWQVTWGFSHVGPIPWFHTPVGSHGPGLGV